MNRESVYAAVSVAVFLILLVAIDAATGWVGIVR